MPEPDGLSSYRERLEMSFKPETTHRTGAWIAGVRGDIAATLMVGTWARAAGLVSDAGLTTAMPPLSDLSLVRPDNIRFGGLDIGGARLAETAASLYKRSRTIDRDLLKAMSDRLVETEKDVLDLPEMAWDSGGKSESDSARLKDVISVVRTHIRAFKERHRLERVIVVNLTSAQPVPASPLPGDTLGDLEQAIEDNRRDLITSSICYAYAALSESCPYVNFTPNEETKCPGIVELAELRRIPFCGDDGKTGETLIKTALAHMFAYRNLQVLSWEGVNLLGNNDGKTLQQPRNRETKLRHKENVLENILGYQPHAGVTINYVPSLGDWKTAWDLIHFRGFLDVPMTMQFTWQGCDSILAAPLVLDLIRLADFAHRKGEYGPMRQVAAFFKDPQGVEEMDLHRQYGLLLDYAARHLTRSSEKQGTA
jgi:myo-inositol-1-phosphate synthase